MTIIELQARPDGGRGVQSQSHRSSCWLEGWVEVPQALEGAVWESGGYCTLELDEGGALVGITPTERPAPVETATAEERLEAQVTYTAMMTDTLLPE